MNHQDPVMTAHPPGSQPGSVVKTARTTTGRCPGRPVTRRREIPVTSEAAVTFAVDVHHHVLPDFFWQATNEGDNPVGGITPTP
jgi:hypothetical protein